MKVRMRIALLTLSAVVAGRLASAQPAAPSITLSLDEAVTRAVAASHRIEETRARGDAATASVDSRHASTLPQVTAVEIGRAHV